MTVAAGTIDDIKIRGSQLALHVTYNSNVLSTGRTPGIQNFGLAPGVFTALKRRVPETGDCDDVPLDTYNVPKALPGEPLILSEAAIYQAA